MTAFKPQVVYTCLHDIDDSVTRLRNAATILSEISVAKQEYLKQTLMDSSHTLPFQIEQGPTVVSQGINKPPANKPTVSTKSITILL